MHTSSTLCRSARQPAHHASRHRRPVHKAPRHRRPICDITRHRRPDPHRRPAFHRIFICCLALCLIALTPLNRATAPAVRALELPADYEAQDLAVTTAEDPVAEDPAPTIMMETAQILYYAAPTQSLDSAEFTDIDEATLDAESAPAPDLATDLEPNPATDPGTDPEPDLEPALPPVPATAPEATAELVATSVFFEHLENYPYVTIDELISFGEFVEAPLYYAAPLDYTEDDLLWLARIIDREAGSDRYPDILQLLVGNVVLNSIASVEFPDNIKEVIFAPKAYGYDLAAEHLERKTPSDRALRNAERLLDGQRFCPPSVIFQANGRQGTGDFLVIDDELSGRISYFCYAYHMQKYEA